MFLILFYTFVHMKKFTSPTNSKTKQPKQLDMLAKQPLAYGGELMKKRKGRIGPRTLDTKSSMHLVLRSTKATGEWSFTKNKNKQRIQFLFKKFALKYGIKIYSVAYVGNHIHCQMRIYNRYAYHPFIRALTAAIAMAVSGTNRWRNTLKGKKFWDYRPFTRVVRGFKALLSLNDYIHINCLEGWGYSRNHARFIIEWQRNAANTS